jgi:hypothetical protein
MYVFLGCLCQFSTNFLHRIIERNGHVLATTPRMSSFTRKTKTLPNNTTIRSPLSTNARPPSRRLQAPHGSCPPQTPQSSKSKVTPASQITGPTARTLSDNGGPRSLTKTASGDAAARSSSSRVRSPHLKRGTSIRTGHTSSRSHSIILAYRCMRSSCGGGM